MAVARRRADIQAARERGRDRRAIVRALQPARARRHSGLRNGHRITLGVLYPGLDGMATFLSKSGEAES